MQIRNRIDRLGHRRRLRRQLTPAEAKLWNVLKGRQIDGWIFRRQFSVGPFILDFFCPSAALAIELDGAAHDHERALAYDARRDAYLRSQGFQTLRFTNDDVRTNIDGVTGTIREALLSPPLFARQRE
jgi:very-short-patch-repair endonuclease